MTPFINIIDSGNVALIDQMIVESVRDIYLYESEDTCKAFDNYIKILESKKYVPTDEFENSIFEVLSDYINNNSMLFESVWNPSEISRHRNHMNHKGGDLERGAIEKKFADEKGVVPSSEYVDRKVYQNHKSDIGLRLHDKARDLHSEAFNFSKHVPDREKKLKQAEALSRGGLNLRNVTRTTPRIMTSVEKLNEERDKHTKINRKNMETNYNHVIKKYKNRPDFVKTLRRGRAMAQTIIDKPKIAAKAVAYGALSKINKKYEKKAAANKYLFNYNKQKRLI